MDAEISEQALETPCTFFVYRWFLLYCRIYLPREKLHVLIRWSPLFAHPITVCVYQTSRRERLSHFCAATWATSDRFFPRSWRGPSHTQERLDCKSDARCHHCPSLQVVCLDESLCLDEHVSPCTITFGVGLISPLGCVKSCDGARRTETLVSN